MSSTVADDVSTTQPATGPADAAGAAGAPKEAGAPSAAFTAGELLPARSAAGEPGQVNTTGEVRAASTALGPRTAIDAVNAASTMAQVAETLEWLNEVNTWQLSGPDVPKMLELVGLVRHRLIRLETHATAEAIERKLPGEWGLSSVDYLMRTEGLSAPAPAPRDAARVVRLAEASGVREGRVAAVMSAFDDGRLSPSKADTLVRFHDDAKPLSDPQAHDEVMGILTREAKDRCLPSDQYGMMGRAGERVAGLSDRDLQIATRRAMRTIKAADELDKDEQIARNGRALHSQQWDNAMTEYRFVLDPEAAAIVDAAISGLSAPTPVDGVPDSRSAARRRADALVMIIQRGVSAPGEVPKTEKAQVMVTISYEDLVSQLRGSGVAMTGQVLSPQTVRRMACEAGIIPMVLGTQGEILDIGRLSRLFTPGQRRAMWHRDKGCTFPACTMPAAWCEAHHILYWSNGGGTDLSNGALLCPRHHTHVHQHDLTATVTATGVTWHT